MSTAAWVTMFLGLLVLFGGLFICITIALKTAEAGRSAPSEDGDA